MNFSYTAKSKSGELTSGLIEGDSLAQARCLLRERGFFVMVIKPAAKITFARRKPIFSKRGGRVPRRDLLALTSQLSTLARAGVDLASALRTLHSQATQPTLKLALEKVHEEVSGGKPVSAALAAQGHVFGPAYVASVAAGEASGKLPEVLTRLARMLRDEIRQIGTLRAMLAYPVILAVVSGSVLFALVFFVLPQFSGVFKEMEVPLPAITAILLRTTDLAKRHAWLWIVPGISACVGLYLLRKSEPGRRCRDYALLSLRMLRDVTRCMLIGRSFRLLSTMLESGIPLLDAIRLTKASLGNHYFRKLYERLEQAVVNGREISTVFAECWFVPPSIASMVGTGERTGTLANVTQILGEFYEEEGETRLRALSTMLEPLIIVVMGTLVGVVVLSVMLPMFDFATMSNSGH